METPRDQAQPGGDDLYFRPTKATTKKVRRDLESLWIIYQAKLLEPLDLDRWIEIFETTVSNLLSTQPLQTLTKRARLGVVMSVVGSGRTHLHTPAVLAVLATDWSDEWACFKLLQDTVRQASLARLRSEWGFNAPAELHVSQKRMADLLCLGVEKTAASWRALGIGGSARHAVEKAGRELRGVAARCRGAGDRPAARKLLASYLASHRVDRFTQALITWGQEQLGASKPTIFDQAFPFLGPRQIQASRSRADARRVPKGTQNPTNSNTNRLQPPAAHGPSFDVTGKVDTQTGAETSRWEEGKEKHTKRSEGSRKRRRNGVLLRLDERVIVRKVGHPVRRHENFGPGESEVPTRMLAQPDATSELRSPRKRLHAISRAPGDDVSSLPPCSPVSKEHTTAGSTSPQTNTDDIDGSWCVTDVDDDSSDNGNNTRLMVIQGRIRKRRVFPDDECDNESTMAARGAAAAARVRQASRRRSSDEDGESSQPQSLSINQALSEGVVDSQAGQKGTEMNDGNEGGSCDGFCRPETESGPAFTGELASDCIDDGADGDDGEEDETDEELAGRVGACGTTLEEEDMETDEEIEMSTWARTGHRRQPQKEDGEADPDNNGVGTSMKNRADDVRGSSSPPVKEMPSKNAQQVEPNGERRRIQKAWKSTTKKTPHHRVLKRGNAPMAMVQATQGTTNTCDRQDTSSDGRNEVSPSDEGTKNGIVGGIVDDQPPGRPTHFMRVYGSPGITRVRESMAAWFSQRHSTS